MEENKLSSNETIKISTIDLNYYIQFNDIKNNNEFVGKFFLNDDNKIDFESDATESAKLFIEELKRMWLNQSPIEIKEISSKDLDPEYASLVNENFWDLI